MEALPTTGRVRRDRDIVRRPIEFWSAAVHGLPHHLEVADFPAPRLVRIEGHEEVLSWVDGESGPSGWAKIVPEAGLRYWAAFMRRYHTAVADYRPPHDSVWSSGPGGCGPGEIVVQAALHTDQLTAPAAVSAAMGASVAASVAVITTMNAQIGSLAGELHASFEQHPDAQVVRSLPGLATILGAQVLGEFGDEPDSYRTAKSRKKITPARRPSPALRARRRQCSPVTSATCGWQMPSTSAAFAALKASPGARTFYDQHRAAGNTHHAALRALGNRLVGILHGCLNHHELYDETIAWGHRQTKITQAA